MDSPPPDPPLSDAHLDEAPSCYGQEYYACHCGPVPYDRSHPEWAKFFGTIADELIRTFRPLRVFDAGCAHGFLVEALWDRGVEAFGRDISNYAVSQVRADVRPFCAQGSIAEPIEGRFDLVVCIEVIEHMSEEDGVRAVAAMTDAAANVVFSSSPTDLTEPTHINVKPPIYWMRRFAACGFAPNPTVTLPTITPYALLFERSDEGRSERDLSVCAELVRRRMEAVDARNRIGALEAAAARTEAELRSELRRRQDSEAAQAETLQLAEQNAQQAALQAAIMQRHLGIAEHDRNTAAAERAALQNAASHLEAQQATAAEHHARQDADAASRIAALDHQTQQQQSAVIDLQSRVTEAQAQVAIITASTLWRATRPIRRAGAALPTPLRRLARRAAKLAWWTVTLQLPTRRRARLRARRSAAEIAKPLDRESAAQIETLRQSELFDDAFYLAHPAPLQPAPADPARHYLELGVNQERQPNVLFDPAWYAAQGALPQGVDPLLHYVGPGETEGRKPHPLFDPTWYRDRYADVPGRWLAHFLHFGRAEGRWPNPDFDPAWYLANNEDVRQSGADPITHYALFGAAEGRDTKAPQPSPLRSERAAIVQSGLFDEAYYLHNNADVAGPGYDPIDHYLDHGCAEGRRPNPMFDGSWYLREYRDVAAAKINPLFHYAAHGAAEGRNPHPDFSTFFYARNCPDPIEPGLNPLTHYLRIGQSRGYPTFSPAMRYRERVGRERVRDADEHNDLLQHIAVMTVRPRFLVLVEGDDGPARDASVEALAQSLYPPADILHDRAALDARTADPANTFLLWLAPGDIPAPRALYAFAAALNAHPALDLVYADEDTLDHEGRRDPYYKPDWSPDHLEAIDYVGPACCMRLAACADLLPEAVTRYDLLLRLTERSARIGHVRQVLLHRRHGAADPTPQARIDADRAALQGRLKRTGRRGEIVPLLPGKSVFRIDLDLDERPLISVVIPTASKIVDIDGRRVDLLVNCIETIVTRSTYPNLEFIIVDNGDLDRSRLDHLSAVAIQYTTYTDPVFNVAKKLNQGAAMAQGSVLLLLNDDIEPLGSDWIERMLAHLAKPHVGVVGAKLLFSDMTIQHIGVVLNAGNPDHVRRWVPRDDEGYVFSSCVPRNFLAVTGACMLTRTDLYREVGGYTEALGVSFNDVDYCFKLRERGYTAVTEPGAELIHFESKSRIASLNIEERDYFQTRWAPIATDPFYNEDELTVASPSFEVHPNERLI